DAVWGSESGDYLRVWADRGGAGAGAFLHGALPAQAELTLHMFYSFSLDRDWPALSVFGFFVAVVLGLSFYLGRRAKSAKGYYAAHGEIHWFVNGIAFAGDYLSAA